MHAKQNQQQIPQQFDGNYNNTKREIAAAAAAVAATAVAATTNY